MDRRGAWPNSLLHAAGHAIRGLTASLVNRGTNARCRTGVVMLLALIIVVPPIHASNRDRVRTVEQLRVALKQGNLAPGVFTKGDQVRLYFTNAEQRVMFKADWDRTRVKVEGFGSHLATLKFDASPPALPGPGDKWHAVKVLASDQCRTVLPRVPASDCAGEPEH